MTYATAEFWETYDGITEAYNAEGACIVSIGPAQNAASAAKWGEACRPGRTWTAYREDGAVTHGHSADLRTAKRDALAALTVTP